MDWTRTPEALVTAAKMARLVKNAMNDVEGLRLSEAEARLNAVVVQGELAGAPSSHLYITVDALRRISEHLRSEPEPRVTSARAELRQLLGFWTDGWKR